MTRGRVRVVLVLSVILVASLVPIIQVANLLVHPGGVRTPSASPDYSAALQAFTRLGGRIVVVGPKDFVGGVAAQAQALGLESMVVPATPSELPQVVSEFNRSLIVDDFGAQPVNYTLAADLAANSFVVYLNASVATLESAVDGALYVFSRQAGYPVVTLPLLTSGPIFVGEGFTALGGYPYVDVDYNTTLLGFVYAWYESFHGSQISDPCGVNAPSGYYKAAEFTDAGNPYSDGYATWYYDECIEPVGSATPPEWWPLNAYTYSDVAPTSNYALRVQGLAVDTNYGYTLYRSRQASTFVSPDIPTPYPVPRGGVTSYSLIYYYNFMEGTAEVLTQVIVDTVGDPVSMTNSLYIPYGAPTWNNTWLFEPIGYNYGVSYVSAVGELDSMFFTNRTQSLYAYMMLDSNFTLASQPNSPNIYTSCVNYYYYALRVQWEVLYNPSGSQPIQPQAAPTLTPSGPYSTWYQCTYHPTPT